jgi:glycogen phosphorylase
VFLENYDMSIARYLVQGVDVWLNTPQRPKEASGTSGMKVIYNGGLNCSILDGWWAEGYKPTVGWAIGNGETYGEEHSDLQDAIESQALYNLLEQDLIPLFYERGRDGLPRQWIAKVKAAMRELGPFFNTRRMVQQYHEQYYQTAFEREINLTQPDLNKGLEYVRWKQNIEKTWSSVRVKRVETSEDSVKVGVDVEVRAVVQLGALKPSDVRVQLYYGPLNTRGEIDNNGTAVDMKAISDNSKDGEYTFVTKLAYDTSGARGMSVRVLPYNEHMSTVFQPGMITWA